MNPKLTSLCFGFSMNWSVFISLIIRIVLYSLLIGCSRHFLKEETPLNLPRSYVGMSAIHCWNWSYRDPRKVYQYLRMRHHRYTWWGSSSRSNKRRLWPRGNKITLDSKLHVQWLADLCGLSNHGVLAAPHHIYQVCYICIRLMNSNVLIHKRFGMDNMKRVVITVHMADCSHWIH